MTIGDDVMNESLSPVLMTIGDDVMNGCNELPSLIIKAKSGYMNHWA